MKAATGLKAGVVAAIYINFDIDGRHGNYGKRQKEGKGSTGS
jgi:hypothetical protein